MLKRHLAGALAVALFATSCGGGGDGGSGDDNGGTTPPPPTTPTPPPATTALEISKLELAQTHVVPEAGLSWSLVNANEHLHAIGGREALAVMTLSATNGSNVELEGWRNGTALGVVPVTAGLPPTEAAGPAYASGRHSAKIPASWMVPGLQLRVRADNFLPGAFRQPVIGADSPLTLRVLPFYLFGANATNSIPPAEIATVDVGTTEELFAKWPVATLVAQNHPAGHAVWPRLVIGPSGERPAYVVHNTDQEQKSFQIMGAVLTVLGQMLRANGEAPGPYQYYAPLIMFNAAGAFVGPGGGLGSVGGDTGVGDHNYAGIFVHEQGHAFGLPHQGGAYGEGRYPYPGGSLSGSVWGYDATRRQFLAPFVPTTASRYEGCAADTFDGTPRQIDGAGRCVKQDPMQSGAGDEADGYRFATFSDYSTAMMQRHLEGVASTDANGNVSYDGGSIVADATFSGGYKRWDSRTRQWVAVAPQTTSNGLYGFDSGLPHRVGVPVHSIAITYSRAGTAGTSQIYPPLSYTGNLVRGVDPTDPDQRANIVPNTGPTPWYCHDGGCDFTVRVTYTNGSVHHVLLQRGFRPWFEPTGTPEATTTDPNHGSSFRTWVVNVPGEHAVQKIELLDTPRGWEGLPSNPVVLASRTSAPGIQSASLAPIRVDASDKPCTDLVTVTVPRSAQALPRCPDSVTTPPSSAQPRWR